MYKGKYGCETTQVPVEDIESAEAPTSGPNEDIVPSSE